MQNIHAKQNIKIVRTEPDPNFQSEKAHRKCVVKNNELLHSPELRDRFVASLSQAETVRCVTKM